MTADTITAIKKALEGVTHAPGKWEAEGTAVYCDDATGQRVCDTKGEHLFWSEDQKQKAAAYIAATNPVDISELLSTLESLQRENEALKEESGRLEDENSDLRYQPWPEWARAVLKVIRSGSGYDGYDDATEGVDMPLELSEHLSEMQNNADRQQARAETAEAEVKRLRNKVAARALTDKQLADEIEAIDEACKGGFGEGGGSPGEWWHERADELEHERKRRELESQLHQHNSRTALSSTGDTHGN